MIAVGATYYQTRKGVAAPIRKVRVIEVDQDAGTALVEALHGPIRGNRYTLPLGNLLDVPPRRPVR